MPRDGVARARAEPGFARQPQTDGRIPFPNATVAEPAPTREDAPGDRSMRPVEVLIVLVVVAAVVAMAVWFLFISSGGIGPGTV